jgi:hypothetical protein
MSILIAIASFLTCICVRGALVVWIIGVASPEVVGREPNDLPFFRSLAIWPSPTRRRSSISCFGKAAGMNGTSETADERTKSLPPTIGDRSLAPATVKSPLDRARRTSAEHLTSFERMIKADSQRLDICSFARIGSRSRYRTGEGKPSRRSDSTDPCQGLNPRPPTYASFPIFAKMCMQAVGVARSASSEERQQDRNMVELGACIGYFREAVPMTNG